jgi:kynureninase
LQYAIESHIRLHQLDPKTCFLEIFPRKGEKTLRTEDILARIEAERDSLALVLFSGVQYYTGQLFDIPTITAAAHR